MKARLKLCAGALILSIIAWLVIGVLGNVGVSPDRYYRGFVVSAVVVTLFWIGALGVWLIGSGYEEISKEKKE